MPEQLDTKILPLLPLSSGVVLPAMVVTVTLETDEAKAAIQAARSANDTLLLVPRSDDGRYARVGTVAHIEEMGRTPGGQEALVIRGLYRALIETLQDAVKHRGSSLADEQYRDLFGEVGEFQSQHKVYDREGQSCRRCRSTIVRVKVNDRSSFLCPQCQV